MKSDLTLEIESQAIKQFKKMGVFICPECTFKRAWINDIPANCSIKEFNFNPKYNQIEGKHIRSEIVDILELNSQKGWICYEIKISKSDFHSNAIKSFVGNYNYYLMPEDLYEQVKKEIPKEIGVYTYNGRILNLSKKARKQELVDDIDEQLNYGMIRALDRERVKQREKIKSSILKELQEYENKLQTKIKNKKDERWEIKHNLTYDRINEQNAKIEELDIELDLLEEIHRNLQFILIKI